MTQISIRVARGASGPDRTITLGLTSGAALDITGASAVNWVWRPSDDAGASARVGASSTTEAMTISDSENGLVVWAPVSPLIDTVGFYVAQVHVTLPTEPLLIFPESGYIIVEVVESLAA